MNKLDYLIEYLLKEKNQDIEDLYGLNDQEKKYLYRSLVNIREPKSISEDFLQIEDEYLAEELKKKNITNARAINTIKEQYNNTNVLNSDKICIWQGDITKVEIGAIVNAGNSQGLGCFIPNHNCIDNQINTFAGIRLRLACNEIMKDLNYNLETGKAIITKGYNLPCEYIIQTVGTIIENEVTEINKKELAECYKNSLQLAIDNGIKTIAFPCISTGVFRFPRDIASKIAIKTVDEFISKNPNKIYKVVFSLWSDEDVIIYERNIE